MKHLEDGPSSSHSPTMRELSEMFSRAEVHGKQQFEDSNKRIHAKNWVTHMYFATIYAHSKALHVDRCKANAPLWLKALILIARNFRCTLTFVLGALAYRFYLSWFVL